ncbi:VWA domain-containing protein, partial [Candidatus Uhrbacteria bacterium]|nr:VWA domain-containing protein [Candidatus Uhrbacteria bacterium]
DGTEGAPGSNVNITGVTQVYTAPYLLDFTFSLRDNAGRPVVGEPRQFQVACMEDGFLTSSEENPAYFAKASNKQLKVMLVLDYSASMASIRANGDADADGVSDSLEAMETSAKDVFLPGLSGAAQVGIYEFHRETDPERVLDFTVDRAFAAQRIDAIQSEYVASFWGASRCWDAVYAAVDEFASPNRNDENNNVIFISDGHDTSSEHTKEELIEYAKEIGVRVYCIGYGNELDAGTLQSITSQTDGFLYVAENPAEFSERFRQILDDLDAQYTLRWATLKRVEEAEFLPSFVVLLPQDSVSYSSQVPYVVDDFKGNELRGSLRLVPSIEGNGSTYLLRAQY